MPGELGPPGGITGTVRPQGAFPSAASGKDHASQCRRHKRYGFNSWVGMIPWRRAWHPTPSILAWRILWTEEPGGLQSIRLQSQTQLKWPSTHTWPKVQRSFPQNPETSQACLSWSGVSSVKVSLLGTSLVILPLQTLCLGPGLFCCPPLRRLLQGSRGWTRAALCDRKWGLGLRWRESFSPWLRTALGAECQCARVLQASASWTGLSSLPSEAQAGGWRGGSGGWAGGGRRQFPHVPLAFLTPWLPPSLRFPCTCSILSLRQALRQITSHKVTQAKGFLAHLFWHNWELESIRAHPEKPPSWVYATSSRGFVSSEPYIPRNTGCQRLSHAPNSLGS